MSRTIEGADAGRSRALFGPFEFDCSSAGDLYRDGTQVKLQEQPARLLTILLENAGRLVPREQLRERLWPADTFVDFDHSLNTAVRKLRTALDDSAEAPRWIETVARHGYRFIGAVEWRDDRPSAVAAGESAVGTKRSRILSLLLAALVITTSAFLILRSSASSESPVTSVAVLPFSNADAATAHVSEAVTEGVINSLSNIADLRVIARSTVFALKDAESDPRRAGRELDVPAVVAGRFNRVGETVTINVELIDTADGAQVWSRRYEGTGDGIASMQRAIAGDLARRLRPRLRATELARIDTPLTTSPEAYDLYMKGLYAWNRRGPSKVALPLDYFRQALAIDPRFARAWIGLASTYGVMVGYGTVRSEEGQPLVFAAVERALALDPQLAEAYSVRGAGRHQYLREFAAAGNDFRRAITLNPSDSTAHSWYAIYLWETGHPHEARREIELAHELDPLSPPITRARCWHLYLNRRFEEAVAFDRRMRALDPEFGNFQCLHDSLIALGRHDEAIEEMTRPGRALGRHVP
ncbi:MAG: winged helix-turn-helix domain-containing protein, partial [Thermoanaerobaculia bacterium]